MTNAGLKVVIADCNFPDTDNERRELAAVGADVAVGQCATEDEVIGLCADADGIIMQYAPITRRVLERLRKCKVVSRYGVGVDTIDVAAATDFGIWVGNVPSFCTVEVAEHALAMLMACNRRLFQLDRSVHKGGWTTVEVMGPTLPLARLTLGLIGFGNIARALAMRAKALGMRVLATSPHTTPELAARHGAERADLDTIFAESDFVCLMCPLTPATHHIVDLAALARMKPTTFVINVSRGALIDQPALVAALQSKRIAGAALDVLEKEPVPADDPLTRMDNVILTPHSGYYSVSSLADLQTRVAQNVVGVLQGGRPLSAVNEIGG